MEEKTPSETSTQSSRRRKTPRKVDPGYLERAALYYLERYASSASNLRRVLMRKVANSARAHGTDPEEGAAWVDALVARYVDAGLLDDRLYAEGRAGSLTREGASGRRIARTLAAKGVAGADIEAALAGREEAFGEDDKSADRAAAERYARRRRLGPWRSPEKRAEMRMKDLAALARQGFDLDTARAVIDIDSDGEDDAGWLD